MMDRLEQSPPEVFVCPVCGEGIYEYIFYDAETGAVLGCDGCAAVRTGAVSVYECDFSEMFFKKVF